MEIYYGYKPVKILDTFVKIYGQRLYHHKGRDEYSIERDHMHLSPLNEIEQEVFNELLEFEKCVRDAQDRHDDEGRRIFKHNIDEDIGVKHLVMEIDPNKEED